MDTEAAATMISNELMTRATKELGAAPRRWVWSAAYEAATLSAYVRAFNDTRLDHDGAAYHARLTRNCAEMLPALTDMLGADLAGTIFARVVGVARNQWTIDNAGILGTTLGLVTAGTVVRTEPEQWAAFIAYVELLDAPAAGHA
jgi:hypothetical protein